MATTSGSDPVRELRLAVVMNGGVSLAVWMSGVTHELNNCRLASSWCSKPDSSRAVWQEILAAANTTVVVDVVAGASAGGINGTVLARAIAMDRDLADLRPLWFEQAALSEGHLLARRPSPTASVLDGGYFLRRVEALLREQGEAPAEAPAEAPTVTLLVTATALPIAESASEVPEPVRDSRRVYRFVAKPGVPAGLAGVPDLPAIADQNDFLDIPTLALGARASASFPAAFQPVEETPGLKAQRITSSAAKGRWLMDGGVLDNAPFEPMLGELRRRAVSAAFDRAVLYVNPSPPPVKPQTFDVNPSPRPVKPQTFDVNPSPPPVKPQTFSGEQPGILRTLAALVSATREPDRRLDTEGLLDALDMARYAVTDPDRVLASTFRDEQAESLAPPTLHLAADALMKRYQQSRRASVFLTASRAPSLDAPAVSSPTDEALKIPDVLVPADCQLGPDTEWHWGLAAAGRVLRWWGRALAKQYSRDGSRQQAFSELGPTQRLIQTWGDGFDAAVAPHRGNVASWYRAAEEYLGNDNLSLLVTKLLRATAEQVAPALGAPSAEELLHVSLDLEVINRAMSWRSDSTTDVPKFAYWQITPASEPPFDLGKASAQDSEWPDRKLYGERWKRFGAFASEDGRKWDWLWGRLDAAMTLSKQILCDAKIPDSDTKRLQSALVQAILSEEGQSDTGLKTGAEKMLVLTGRDMWHNYASAASTRTRTSLRLLAAELTGTLVPESWPKPIHALVDTSDQWRRHGPATPVERSRLALYRLLGMTAQTIAGIKVAALVKGKIPNPPAGRRNSDQSDR